MQDAFAGTTGYAPPAVGIDWTTVSADEIQDEYSDLQPRILSQLEIVTRDELVRIHGKEEARNRYALEKVAKLTSTEGRKEATSRFQSKVMDPQSIQDMEPKESLIDNFLDKDSLMRIYGPPKSLKSFIMLDMAACVGAGIEWMGNETKRSKVLYVVAEGVRGIGPRVKAWEQAYERPMTGVDFYNSAVQINSDDDMHDLISFVTDPEVGGHDLIVFDTQARCTVGVDENSATENGLLVKALDTLKQVSGACVMLVHHSGVTGGRARGSTAVLGAVDGEFEVKRDKKAQRVTLVTVALKDRAEPEPLCMVEDPQVLPQGRSSLALKALNGAGRPELPVLTKKQLSIVRVMLDKFDMTGCTVTELAHETDINKNNLGLNGLLKLSVIEKRGTRHYPTRLGNDVEYYSRRNDVTQEVDDDDDYTQEEF